MPSPYPPLTPLSTMPLHGGAVDFLQGTEFACAYDGPRHQGTLYDWRCEGCVDAAARHLEESGDEYSEWRLSVGDEPAIVSHSWLLNRAMYWRTQVD